MVAQRIAVRRDLPEETSWHRPALYHPVPDAVIAALSLLAGVLAGVGAARTPCGLWLVVAGLTVAVAWLSRGWKIAPARSLASALAGMALAIGAVGHWQSLRMHPGSTDQRVLLEGRIVGVPERRGVEWRFDAQVRVLAPRTGDERWRQARLVWREPPVEPAAGEHWQWLVRLDVTAGARNFAGVDPERLALRDRVHLQGRVMPAAMNRLLSATAAGVDPLREFIARQISMTVADPDAAALMTALAVGLTDGVSRDQWRVFNATGTTHLVAISGLHVTLFAWLAIRGSRVLWRILPLPGMVDREPFALLLGLMAAGGYSLLAGFSVPTQRTWLMLAIFVLARLAARPLSAARVWSLALIAVLLFDVLAPLAAGFWLSFVAVGVILLRENGRLVPAGRWRRLLALQLAIMLALAPLTLAVFGGVSVVGFAVNLVAIPVVSLVFVPLVLLGALWVCLSPLLLLPVEPAFVLAEQLYHVLWPWLVSAADLPLAQWRVAPPGWWYVLAVGAAWVLLQAWPRGLKVTAAAATLPLVFLPTRLPESGSFRVQVLDAGRGSAMLITTRTQAILYDTGDTWGTQGARIAQHVIPALEAADIRRVDLLLLPRLDPERAQGVALLASERVVERILVAGGWPASRLPVDRCADARFVHDAVEFQTFAAGRSGQYCVLRVSAGTQRLLIAGEMDAQAERELRARLPAEALASQVVVIGRQGSEQASSAQWIEATGARIAVASGGMADSQSRARTLARWRASGARLLDTRADGAIEIEIGKQGVQRIAVARTARYPFAWRRFE